jgi:hypothetical protein
VRHPALSFILVNRVNETWFKKRNARNFQNYDPQIKEAKAHLPSKNEFNSLCSTLALLPDLSFPNLRLCKRITPHLFFKTCVLFYAQARSILNKRASAAKESFEHTDSRNYTKTVSNISYKVQEYDKRQFITI